MTLPTFIVVGAPRCGTTSLHYYLRQHSQVCMSAIKEPNYFLFGPDGAPRIAETAIIRKSIRDRGRYAALFEPTPATCAIGEVSPLYLYTQETAAHIGAECGPITIVCVLRRPAARAWSHFLYAFPDVPTDQRAATFAELVTAEISVGPGYEPYRTRTHLVRLGRYHDQVARYQETFGADNVIVLLTEDLAADPSGALATICAAVGVDPLEHLEARHYNRAPTAEHVRRWPGPRRMVRRLQPFLKTALPPRLAGRLVALRDSRVDPGLGPITPMDSDVARRIADWCAEDILALSARIGCDLSSWLSEPHV